MLPFARNLLGFIRIRHFVNVFVPRIIIKTLRLPPPFFKEETSKSQIQQGIGCRIGWFFRRVMTFADCTILKGFVSRT